MSNKQMGNMSPSDINNFLPVRIIRIVIFGIVLCVWTIIGLLAYIPLLVRMIARYAAFTLATTFQEGEDMFLIRQNLNFAIQFYPRGFESILHSFHNHDCFTRRPDQYDHMKVIDFNIKDYVWTCFFWGSAFLMYLGGYLKSYELVEKLMKHLMEV